MVALTGLSSVWSGKVESAQNSWLPPPNACPFLYVAQVAYLTQAVIAAGILIVSLAALHSAS